MSAWPTGRPCLIPRLPPGAPELRDLSPDADLCRALLLDSVAFLNFVIAVDETLHVAVPQADDTELATLRGCIDYLMRASERRT
jgi:acyl carrier protein